MYAVKFSNTDEQKNEQIDFDFVKEVYKKGYGTFGLDNLLLSGSYKLMGWQYDFTQELKRFLAKQYGVWREYYAPNKTLLRKALYGTVEKIVELV